MAWPNVYTYNFCSNPSFEADLTGVLAVNGGQFMLDTGTGLYGSNSLTVTTPGQVANEGVILPPGAVLATGTGCVSFYVVGSTPTASGTLTAYAIDTTTSTTLGSTTFSYSPANSWQQVVVNGITLTNAHNIAVYVETVGIQQCQFNIDAVQYEPSLTLNGGNLPTPYVDGDQLFGVWVGAVAESASYKPYQFMIGATGGIQTSGSGSLLARGAVFSLVNTDPATGPTTVNGQIDLSGKPFQAIDGVVRSGGPSVLTSGFTTVLLYAGLNDFAVFNQNTDVDPAISLIGYNNAGISTGVNTSGNAGYTRPYATFSAPIAYVQPATGKNLWNTAAYFSVGYQFASIAAGGSQNITHVQAETVPNNGTPVVPSAFIRPRALTATLAPTRLNYVPNPSFETVTTGWTADASGVTITRVSGGAPGTGSSFSGQVVITGANTGAYISVSNLIVGEQYTVSAYVKVTTTGVSGVTISVGAASSTFAPSLNAWVRGSLTFTAVNSNVLVDIKASAVTTFQIDSVLLEVGGALNTYGDGNTSGWNWENPATPNVTRSYYYVRGNIAYASVQSILSSHLPLGLHAYAPVYNSPPTQYNA